MTGSPGPPRWGHRPGRRRAPRRCSRRVRATSGRTSPVRSPRPGQRIPLQRRRGPVRAAVGTASTVALPGPAATGGQGRRASLGVRGSAACLLVAVVAVGAARLVAVRLVAVTARTVAQEVLAQQADVVAAQLAETGGGLRAGAGMRRVVNVLAGQGVTVVVVTARGPRNAGILAPILEQADVRRCSTGSPCPRRRRRRGCATWSRLGPRPPAGSRWSAPPRPARSAAASSAVTSASPCWPGSGWPWSSAGGRAGLARPLRRPRSPPASCAPAGGTCGCPSPGPAEVSDVAGAMNELADALACSEERQRRVPPVGLARAAHTVGGRARVRRVAGRRRRHRPRSRGRRPGNRPRGRPAGPARGDPWSWHGWRPTTSGSIPSRSTGALAADAAAIWETRSADADVRFVLQTRPTRPGPGRSPAAAAGRRRAGREHAARRARRARAGGRDGGDTAGSWLQVRDGGPGLAPEDYPVVFERRGAARPLPGAPPGGHRWRGPRTRARAGGADERDDPRGAGSRGRGVLHPHLPRRRCRRHQLLTHAGAGPSA